MTQLRDFLNAGGRFVLYLIAGVTFWMWAMIIERLIYWGTAHGGVSKRAQARLESALGP